MTIECPFKEGDRVKLIAMPDDPNPIPEGVTGTVQSVYPMHDVWVIGMIWDNSRTLNVMWPHDTIEKIEV